MFINYIYKQAAIAHHLCAFIYLCY